MTASPILSAPFNISLVGVGGQGILLTSNILAHAAMNTGHDVKKSEVHGMSQRGGTVMSQVRFGQKVHSPIIPDGASDILIAFERLEALRWAHLVRPCGRILVNNMDRVPITVSSGLQPPATDMDARLAAYPGLVLLEANALAEQAGTIRTANVVLVGALSTLIPFEPDHWQNAMRECIREAYLEVNQRAFELGRAAMMSKP